MTALEEAAEIVSRKWKSSGKSLIVMLVLAIGTGLILLLGFLFSRLIRLMMPARISNWSL